MNGPRDMPGELIMYDMLIIDILRCYCDGDWSWMRLCAQWSHMRRAAY